MDYEDLWEPIYCQVFLDIDLAFARAALEACLDHPLCLDELHHAVLQRDTAHALIRDLHAQVHEVVESTICEATAEALRAIDKLTFE